MLTTEKATRHCAECETVLHGRSDQKFCSRGCRNLYNNRHNSSQGKLVRKINNSLKRNRQILSHLNPNGKIRIPMKKLRNEGFNFDFFTSIYTTQEGRQYFFCYEHGYLPLDQGYVMLVRREPRLP